LQLFWTNFIGNVAQGDGSEAIKGGGSRFFWEESQERGVSCSSQLFSFVGETYHSYEVFLDDVPTFFIEMQGEAIRARSFVILELVQGSEDFLLPRWVCQGECCQPQ
jgi:hypothetical protein